MDFLNSFKKSFGLGNALDFILNPVIDFDGLAGAAIGHSINIGEDLPPVGRRPNRIPGGSRIL